MKLSHTKLIILSGLIWFGIGFYLLQLGLGLLLSGVHTHIPEGYPLLRAVASLFGSAEMAAIALVALALFIGYLKGRYVLGKSAQQGVGRILTFTNPASVSQIYSLKYYILIAAMMGLGVAIKYLGLNHDIRGFIDIIIGSALINGAMIYFRLAQGVSAKSS